MARAPGDIQRFMEWLDLQLFADIRGRGPWAYKTAWRAALGDRSAEMEVTVEDVEGRTRRYRLMVFEDQ